MGSPGKTGQAVNPVSLLSRIMRWGQLKLTEKRRETVRSPSFDLGVLILALGFGEAVFSVKAAELFKVHPAEGFGLDVLEQYFG